MVNTGDDSVEEHASVQQVQMAYQQPVIGTLNECFNLYTQEEKVCQKAVLPKLLQFKPEACKKFLDMAVKFIFVPVNSVNI